MAFQKYIAGRIHRSYTGIRVGKGAIQPSKTEYERWGNPPLASVQYDLENKLIGIQIPPDGVTYKINPVSHNIGANIAEKMTLGKYMFQEKVDGMYIYKFLDPT